MKKLSIVIILVFACLIAIWLKAANKFEETVKNVLISKLGEYTDIVQIDPNQIKINKYLFTFITGKTKWFPYSPALKINNEVLQVDYNPFNKNLTIRSIGTRDDYEIGRGKIYKLNPSDQILLNLKNINNITDNLSIAYKNNNESKFYFASNDTEALSFAKGLFSVSFKNSFKEENYIINFNNFFKQLKVSRIHDLFKDLLTSLNINKSQVTEKEINLISQLSFLQGNLDNEITGTVELNKLYLEEVKKLFIGEKIFKRFIDFFIILTKIKEEEHLIDITLSNKYDDWSDKINLYSTRKNDINNFRLNVNLTSHCKEPKKQLYHDLLSKLYHYTLVENPESAIFDSAKFSLNDSKQLISNLLNLTLFNFGVELSYNNKSKIVDIDINEILNSYKIRLEAQLDISRELINGKVSVNDPAGIITDVTNIIEHQLLPVFEKLKSYQESSFVDFKARTSKLKNEGLNALSAFNIGDKLNSGEAFESKFYFKPSSSELKINDIDLLDIINDVRVKSFLDSGRKLDNE